MWKLCAAITAMGATVLSSLVQAEGITGIYSCSSGVNNDRPVTYVFNSDLMLRNNANATPFEFLSTLNNGMLLYVGRLKSENFDRYSENYGTTKEALPRWAHKEIRKMETRWTEPNFDHSEYILLRTLACSLGVETSWFEHPLGAPAGLKAYADNCQKSIEATAEAGIDDIEEFFVAKNKDSLIGKVGLNYDRFFSKPPL